jgi:hypothetical protein
MPTWTLTEALPVVRTVIKRLLRTEVTTTHDEIAAALRKDAAGQKLIRHVCQLAKSKQRPDEVASSMVAWFSQRHTVRKSDYGGEFKKFKLRPRDRYTYQLADARKIRRSSLRGPNYRRSAIKSTAHKNRRPSTLEEYKQAFSYALGSSVRRVIPAHHNYQVDLKEFLTNRSISAEFERDFVDVQFTARGKTYIGEIKVTGFLKMKEGFRIALGQLLEYAHLRFAVPPRMLMFLDEAPDKKRIALATNLSISVILNHVNGYRV